MRYLSALKLDMGKLPSKEDLTEYKSGTWDWFGKKPVADIPKSLGMYFVINISYENWTLAENEEWNQL